MADDLSGYQVTFKQLPLLMTWTYHIITPSGKKYSPVFTSFISKEAAERSALARIKQLKSEYSITGAELEEKHGS